MAKAVPQGQRIHAGSAFDLENYKLKGDYSQNSSQSSATASANRDRMMRSKDPAQRAMAQGTVPGMGTPMHRPRPPQRTRKAGGGT